MTVQSLEFTGKSVASRTGAGSLVIPDPVNFLFNPALTSKPAVLVLCLFQASDASVTATGWTHVAFVSGNEKGLWVMDWNPGDPTTWTISVGDDTTAMLVVIANASLADGHFAASIPGGGGDATKIECPSLNVGSDVYQPWAYVGFGCALNQVGAFSDFQFGDALIGETTSAGKTIVAGYQLDIRPNLVPTSTFNFTGASADNRDGLAVDFAFARVDCPDCPDCPPAGGWTVGVS